MNLTTDQLRVLLGSRTSEIFHLLRSSGPLTVPEIQERLGTSSKSVYYQVRKLEAARLVASDRSDLRGWRVEAVKGTLQMPDGFQGLEYERLAAQSTARTLSAVGKRFLEAAEASCQRPKLVDDMFIRSAVIHVERERRKEFRRRLEALFDEFGQGEPGEEQPVQAVFALVPVVE